MDGISSVFLSAFILILTILWSEVNKKLYNDIVSPLNILYWGWVFPFLISHFRISGFQSPPALWMEVFVVFITLIMAAIALTPALFGAERNHDNILLAFEAFYRSARFRLVLFMFFCITLGLKVVAEFGDGVIPIIEYMNGTAVDSTLHLVGKGSRLQVVGAGFVVAALFSWFGFLASDRRTDRVIYLLMSVTPIVFGIAKTSKSDVFEVVFYYFIAFYYWRRFSGKDFYFGRTFVVLAILGSGMALLSAVRLNIEEVNLATLWIDAKWPGFVIYPFDEILSILYGYTAMNFDNLYRFLASFDPEYHFGSSVFRPFFSMLMSGDIPRQMTAGVDMHGFIETAVGTFLRDVYFEGGPGLCIFAAILYSSMINYAYSRLRRGGGSTYLVTYMFLAFPWAWLVFNNAFGTLSIYVNMFYAILLLNIGLWVVNLRERRAGKPVGATITRSSDARISPS
jgi:hypothetical protein